MTEKRLIVRDGDFAWVDTVTGYVLEVEDAFDLVNKLHEDNEQLKHDATVLIHANLDYRRKNEQLKTTIANLIEQNRKNNDLLISDIRLLEKALWCKQCAIDTKRLKELRKEFEK